MSRHERSRRSSWFAIASSALVAATCLAGVFAFGRAEDESQSTAKALDESTRTLFVANCAQCHGVNGDGKGTTVLERPARSFKDGGFSYGNTPQAILRTITFGIPGSLMPSFGGALKEDERKALARHVIALGPPQLEVDARDTVMVVRDRPLVVRGKLPPIVDGALERPRGLLIGLPNGLSFEYRTDDVRLLGVRSGDFVDRRDWIGRGGDALQPLGKLVRAIEGGDPRALFELRPGSDRDLTRPCNARLTSTSVVGGVACVEYELIEPGVEPGRERVAHVRETVRSYHCKLGTGWQRDFVLDCRRDTGVLRIGIPSMKTGVVVGPAADPPRMLAIVRLPDGTSCDVIAWRLGPDDPNTVRADWIGRSTAGIEGPLKRDQRHSFSILYVPGVPLSSSDTAAMELIEPMFEETR